MKKKQKCPTRKVTRSKEIKGRFELAPSRQPLRHKAFWQGEDTLMSNIINSHITRDLYQPFHKEFSSLYSCNYNWLDYSSVLYYIYEVRSLKAYVGIKKVDYLKDIYSKEIQNLYEDFKLYYVEVLGLSLNRISNQNKIKMFNTCVWFIFHINRVSSFNQLGLKLSYWVNFYTDCQENIPDEDKIGGKFVQRFTDYLVWSSKAFMYKGYKLKDTYSKSFQGAYYGGDTKACMSLLVFDFDSMETYLHKNKKLKNNQLTYIPEKQSQALPVYEVRKRSGSKETISIRDFEEGWMDKITKTEEVMQKHNKLLGESMVYLGKYQIPELHFRRIWIATVDQYGRIHDDGEFQTKSKKIRKELIIDDERTVTIDLSSIHPRILYTWEGIELGEDFDPYPSLDIKLDSVRLKRYKSFYNLDKYDPIRNLAKVALLILINSNSGVEAKNALRLKLESEKGKLMTRRESEMWYVGIPDDLNIDYVFQKIKDHNKGISKYFTSGVSMDLMNKDSDIILDTIDTLNQVGIVCLPLHDSITVAVSCKDDAKKALSYGYKNVMGTLMNFKCEEE
ncbi:hypothetical protein VPH184E373B_0047 [Vibrio phage 184E37-3b]|nr:hypothetical protein MYOV056v2_p0041 [Vibrio phage 184E37.3a]QZI90014.1 hypothetical protein MYOV057v1_p0099 [Vibrio phage 184E37.1]